MRMSCNGCRVLRKGCADDCILRPCLDWIKSPESQANATLFLAKFYGRAGLINLINSGAAQLQPEIFRSLLYEACGRIINPVYGSVGLMCSGDWERCQAAVEAVLQGGLLIMQVSGDGDSAQVGSYPVAPLQGSDIRHLSKDSAASPRRARSRRSSARARSQMNSSATELMSESEEKFTITGWEDQKNFVGEEELKRAPSQDSFSVETVEQALVNKNEQLNRRVKPEPQLGGICLELTLGLNPMLKRFSSSVIKISDRDT